MATLHPFKGWLPNPASITQVACVPYDVISTDEARSMADGKPDSFLHVIRPEITCGPETDIHSDEVYEAGARELERLLNSGLYHRDATPSLYIYSLQWRGRTQTGIYGCVSVEEYDREVILKHELTRPDKEADRTRHILDQSAHAEPVMLTFRDTGDLTSLMNGVMASEAPFFDFTAEDTVRHTLWKVSNPGPFVNAFKTIPAIYIADGHHRCKSASNAVAEWKDGTRNRSPYRDGDGINGSYSEEIGYFPAVLFPMDQMEILAYNRAIAKATTEQIRAFEEAFSPVEVESPVPTRAGTICAYYGGSWKSLTLPQLEGSGSDPVLALDVSRLQKGILEPYFGIGDPRTDANISFVGGMRGTGELERLVDSGKAAMTWSMYPTSIKELLDVSDAHRLMPPKSTWFEPKLRSGLVIHTF